MKKKFWTSIMTAAVCCGVAFSTACFGATTTKNDEEEEIKQTYYSYGQYPQSRVSDSETLKNLTTAGGDVNSWNAYAYNEDGNEEKFMFYKDVTLGEGTSAKTYRGVYLKGYRPDYADQGNGGKNNYQQTNGYQLYTETEANVYWFKYDAIRWVVLEEEAVEGTTYKTLLSDMIIDSQEYNVSVDDNAYDDSSIRAWLNDTFYETAFTAEQQAAIQAVEVDNGAATTASKTNRFACENTTDKVWLLSYQEVASEKIKLNKSTTPYARIQGAYSFNGGKYSNNGYWWLRSPDFDTNEKASIVYTDGSIGGNFFVDYTFSGVCPVIKIAVTK